MAGMQTVTAATIGGALAFGMALALLGQLKSALARRDPTSHKTPIRRWLFALHVALVPMVLLSGVLLDIYGARAVLVAGSAILSVALLTLSLRASYPHALATMALAGFGASALGTAVTVLMPRAFVVEKTSAALNLGYGFIALGTLLTPLLAEILREKIGLRRTLAAFALLSLVPALLGVLPVGQNGQFAEPNDNPAASLSQPACWLSALVLFFYVPLESSISLWTFTLLAQRGQQERGAAGLLYGFWGAFVGARLLAAFIHQTSWFVPITWDRTLIIVLPILAAVLLGNLTGAGQRGQPRAGLILLGLLLGPILPTLLALLFRVAPHQRGTRYGLAFAAGSLGSFLLAQLLAPRAGHKPLAALRLPILLALFVSAAALVLGLVMP